VISALIATIDGREHWLERAEDALAEVSSQTGANIEIVIEKGHPNWGTAMLAAAERATGDYLWLGSDDMEVQSFGDAIKYADRGFLPAPRVWHDKVDGKLQSCGGWEREQKEGSPTLFPRIPFATREQFDQIGLLPIHYADVRFGTHGRTLGMETVVCRSYEVVHHMAPEGRLDYQKQEKIRIKAEQAEARRTRA
jgi:hypothetical protein